MCTNAWYGVSQDTVSICLTQIEMLMQYLYEPNWLKNGAKFQEILAVVMKQFNLGTNKCMVDRYFAVIWMAKRYKAQEITRHGANRIGIFTVIEFCNFKGSSLLLLLYILNVLDWKI